MDKIKNKLIEIPVLNIKHWNNNYFSITFDYRNIEFIPGQYIEIYFKYGEKIIKRAYSILNKVGDYLEIYVKYVECGVASQILKNVKIGDNLLITKKAKGRFIIDKSYIGDRLFMIGFGSGISPILSIASSGIEELFKEIFIINCFKFDINIPYIDLFRELSNVSPKIHTIFSITNKQKDINNINSQEFEIYEDRLVNILQNGIFESKYGTLLKGKDKVMLCGGSEQVRTLLHWLRDYRGFNKYNGTEGDILIESYL